MAVGSVDPDGAASRALRSAGLRVTMPRLAILAWLGAHPHSTAEAIGAGVREQFGTVSTQAVYDMLALCTTAGLLRRIELAEHPARFERRVGDNHHHIVCRRCGRTEDVDFVIGVRPCLTPARAGGFAVDSAEVVFWGVCPTCQAAGGPWTGRSMIRKYGSDEGAAAGDDQAGLAGRERPPQAHPARTSRQD